MLHQNTTDFYIKNKSGNSAVKWMLITAVFVDKFHKLNNKLTLETNCVINKYLHLQRYLKNTQNIIKKV